MTKLKNKIELSKSTGLGTKPMFDITYEVNYNESTHTATLIPDSIQIHDHVTRRIIREHDILQSEFLTTLCREDAKTVNWWEKMASHRYQQQRLLDNAYHSVERAQTSFKAISHRQVIGSL